MEKVKISKLQADAIMFLTSHYPKANIVVDLAKNDEAWKHEAIGLNGMDMDLLIRALYYGYEVEMTVEEKILDAYKSCGKNEFVGSWEHPENKRAYRQGIAIVCDILEMEIEGVNDRQLG